MTRAEPPDRDSNSHGLSYPSPSRSSWSYPGGRRPYAPRGQIWFIGGTPYALIVRPYAHACLMCFCIILPCNGLIAYVREAFAERDVLRPAYEGAMLEIG
ncbi:protein of unknown function [Rhodovastum atsumiense]|nr:protein of unknown function [Rhodovastum atsumiense]